MKNNPKVSVIVPIYNSEKYVRKMIESLLEQTLKDIEIILVNDGSKDSSGIICDEYSKKDERILVIHKENSGQGESRNVGMKIAKGTYIMFLDADDELPKDSCESMYNSIESNKADYCIGNYIMTDEDGTLWNKPAFDVEKYQEFKLDKNDFKKSFFVMNSTVWNKIYRKQFLVENDIVYRKISPSEDDYFTTLCYIKAKSAYYIPKIIYLYRNVPNSLSKHCSLEYFKGINNAYKVIYESYKENNEINYYRYVYAKKNAYLLCQLIDTEQITREQKLECLKEFEWYFDLNKELKVNIVHESLEKVMKLVRTRDYENALIEMDRLKEYRKGIPDNIRKRMSFPTQENYEEMSKYDDNFKNV